MITVATRDEFAIQASSDAVAGPGHVRLRGVERVGCHVLRFVDDGNATLVRCRVQILHDLRLTVYGHGGTAGQLGEIDVEPAAVERERGAGVHQALASDALADADTLHELHGSLLEHPGAHATFDILPAAGFEHERFDAGSV